MSNGTTPLGGMAATAAFQFVAFEIALQRALVRDQALFGSSADIEARYLQRYFPAQRMYLDTFQPRQRVNAVVVNDDPMHPCFRPAALRPQQNGHPHGN